MGQDLYIRKSITIDAPIDIVWDILTNPDHTQKYMYGTRVDSDWNVGSHVHWVGESEGEKVVYVKGEVVKIEQEKHLAFTVISAGNQYDDTPNNYTTVTYDLTSEGDKTILNLTQGDFADADHGEERYMETNSSWDQSLAKLKEVAES
ncbi:MAG TPA: SRPBCC domain-containing protein [bacterium]